MFLELLLDMIKILPRARTIISTKARLNGRLNRYRCWRPLNIDISEQVVVVVVVGDEESSHVHNTFVTLVRCVTVTNVLM